MYYIVSEIYIGEGFLEGCFYCYFQHVISAIANESLFLIKRAPETQNLCYCNTECLPKPNQQNIKYSSLFQTKNFVPHKYKQ